MTEGTRFAAPEHPSEQVQDPDAYHTTSGWQDKSADLRRAHVVGWARFFDHSKRQARWRAPTKSQGFQRAERRRMPLTRAWRL